MEKKRIHGPSESKYIKARYSPRKHTSPLKVSMSGYELEFCLIDGEGNVSNASDAVIAAYGKAYKDRAVKEEVAKNMVEVTAIPHKKIKRTALYMIENVTKVMEICERMNLKLLPLGTYPGSFQADVRYVDRYLYSAMALGRAKYERYYPRCFGFHYHYAMPKGVFDSKNEFIKSSMFSAVKGTLVDNYNFLIAADPAITTFTQSSPLEGGRYRSKDTRMLYWRGGDRLGFGGVFTSSQLLGGLPPYVQTMSDLVSVLVMRDTRFRSMLEWAGAPKSFIRSKKKLDFAWNPVKVNKLGTLEQRGMDTNYIGTCLGVSVALKLILRAIQQDFYHVIPADYAIKEPFKLEGNVILVPPHSHVRSGLQHESAHEGLHGKDIYRYCSRFYRLARKLAYKEYVPVMRPLKNMLDERETLSDKIIRQVKSSGFSLKDRIPQDVCGQIALYHAGRMERSMDRVRERYEKLV